MLQITKEQKADVLKAIILKSNRSIAQIFIKQFSPESLGYHYSEEIEVLGFKKGTSLFGAAVSEIFSDFKVNKVRLEEIDKEATLCLKLAKGHFHQPTKAKYAAKYNVLIDEWGLLHKKIDKFVRIFNKIKKTK